MKRALEGVLTIDSVEVSIEDVGHKYNGPTEARTTPATSSAPHAPLLLTPGAHARRWTITFTGQPFDLPSLLVSTRAGAAWPDLYAAAGTLGGSSPVVGVATVVQGGLPHTFVTDGAHALPSPPEGKSAGYYYARVSAFNGVGWSAPRLAAVAAVPAVQPPAPPEAVTVARVSPHELAVSWAPPTMTGGAAVTRYKTTFAHFPAPWLLHFTRRSPYLFFF
jgi:hypothetical protein